jgi:hypothetical protein
MNAMRVAKLIGDLDRRYRSLQTASPWISITIFFFAVRRGCNLISSVECSLLATLEWRKLRHCGVPAPNEITGAPRKRLARADSVRIAGDRTSVQSFPPAAEACGAAAFGGVSMYFIA